MQPHPSTADADLAWTLGSTRSYYDELAGDYHRSVVDWTGAVDRQASALDAVLATHLGPGPHAILDCAAGIGTQSLGLASLGHAVHGVDLSPAAVRRAQHEAAARGLPVSFAVADVRELETAVPGRYDAVICCDNSVTHLLTEDDLTRGLAQMGGRQRPDGVVVVTMRDYDRHLATRPRATQPLVEHEGGVERLVFHQWEWLDDCRYVSRLFMVESRDGAWSTRVVEGAVYRAWRRDEVTDVAYAAGARSATWSMPDTTGYHQPVLVARWR